MTRTLTRVIPLAFVLLFAIATALPAKHLLDHANGAERVRDGELIVALYDDGVCEGVEAWFSPLHGKIIVLCGVPQTNLWGGMIFRVTENGGTRFLTGDELGMVTIVVDQYSYWHRHFAACGYRRLATFPSVSRLARESLHIYW